MHGMFDETERSAQPFDGCWSVAILQARDHCGLGGLRNNWHGISLAVGDRSLYSDLATVTDELDPTLRHGLNGLD